MWAGCGGANCRRSGGENRVGPLEERQREGGSVEVGGADVVDRSGWVMAPIRSENVEL